MRARVMAMAIMATVSSADLKQAYELVDSILGDALVVHQNEIGALFGALGSKADARSNDEAHSRLWLFLRISLLAIATAATGAVVVKALAF